MLIESRCTARARTSATYSVGRLSVTGIATVWSVQVGDYAEIWEIVERLKWVSLVMRSEEAKMSVINNS